MVRSGNIVGAFLLCVVVVNGQSCTKDKPPTLDATGNALSGTIRVSGAWALYPMMVRWSEEFRKVHPGFRIDISAGGAGKGLADALGGLVDLGMLSRDITAEETSRGAALVAVVKDSVFPTLNSSNRQLPKLLQTGIKKSILAALWVGGRSLTWGELSGVADPTPVQVYTRSDACGAAETWAKYLGGTQADLQGVAVYGDPGLAEAVKKDPAAIGYNNLNYCFDGKTDRPQEGLAVLPIDLDDNGKLDPGELIQTRTAALAAVRSGKYPSPPTRELFLVTKKEFSGPARVFVGWILGAGQRFIPEAGYIALTEERLKENLQMLQGGAP